MRKERRNISVDSDLNNWLSSTEVDNASELINILLMAYRAYGGDEIEAARYTIQKRINDPLAELNSSKNSELK